MSLSGPTARIRLLIIDDNADFQLLIRTFLQGTRAKGATAYLQKPIDKQILLETLQRVLQESAHATTTHH